MPNTDPRQKLRLSYWVHLLATGFGSGLMPKAPGTWGSLVALPIGAICLNYMGFSLFLFFTFCCFLLGCYLCEKTAKDMQVHDHGAIVWDEFVGIFITLLALPTLNLTHLLIAFTVFRIFDIFKPYPIKYFDQKLTNGFGIMIDDVLAGIYAFVVISLASRIVMPTV